MRRGRGGVRWWALSFHLILAAAAGTGCAKARAASIPQAPPLMVPEPPARVLVPVTDEPLATLPGPDTGLSAPPAIQPPPRQQRRSVPAASESTSPGSTPPAAAAAGAGAPPAEAPRDLRPPQASADYARVQGMIDNAARDIKGVERGKLSDSGKETYDLSVRSRIDAETALKERNFLRAAESAEKAARLAAALVAGQ